MKIKTINLYEFDELSDEAKEKAIAGQIEFEITIMDEDSPYYKYAIEMERYKTPWFLAETIYHNERESLIETIKINEYTFTSDGVMENL